MCIKYLLIRRLMYRSINIPHHVRVGESQGLGESGMTRGHSESSRPGFFRGPCQGHILHLDFLPCQYIDKQCLAQAFPSGSSKSQLMQWKNPQSRSWSYLSLEMLGLRDQFHRTLICMLPVPVNAQLRQTRDVMGQKTMLPAGVLAKHSGKWACYLKTLHWINSLCTNSKWCHDLNIVSEAPSFLCVCDVCVAGEGIYDMCGV